MTSNIDFFTYFQEQAYCVHSNIENTAIHKECSETPTFSTMFSNILENCSNICEKDLIIVELGCRDGSSACTMAKIVKEKQVSSKIICIDMWDYSHDFWNNNQHMNNHTCSINHSYPEIYNSFINNVIQDCHNDIITPVFMPSDTAIELLQAYNIIPDIVYFDCVHDDENVKKNIENYLNLLNKDNGCIFGNSYYQDSKISICLNDIYNTSNVSIEVVDSMWKIQKIK